MNTNNKNNNNNKTNKKKNGDRIPNSIDDLPFTKTETSGTRVESDSMGSIEVPAEHYWEHRHSAPWYTFQLGMSVCPKQSIMHMDT